MLNPQAIEKDFHANLKCVFCHKGNDKKDTREAAHQGFLARPSDDIKNCGICHQEIGSNYSKSLHFTSMGQREGVKARFSHAELKTFDAKVFNQSCRSCHASCGDCHVKSPPVAGITTGLIQGHKFVKKNEGKPALPATAGVFIPNIPANTAALPTCTTRKE
ncbi:MAG TPA: hypothetical protein PK114_04735 [Smithellaceae bacterium]|nr:hypothetical protein [Smithellaceae bacterium]